MEINKKKREQLKQLQESYLLSYSSIGVGIGLTISLIIGAIAYYNDKRKLDTKCQQDEPERSRISIKINDEFAIE